MTLATTCGLSLALLAFWMMCGVLATLSLNASLALGTMTMRPHPTFLQIVAMQFASWLAIAALTPAIVRLTRRFPLTRGAWLRAAGVHLLAIPLFALAYAGLGLVLMAALRGRIGDIDSFLDVISRLASTATTFLVKYALIVGATEAVRHYGEERARAEEAQRLAHRSTALERDLAAARLIALRQQLQPHFLFNALNTVNALVDEDPAAARRVVSGLGVLLRTSLDHHTATELSVGEELDFTDRYVSIERARFGDRLEIAYAIEDSALGAAVPSFILQPLVENAVRHGFARLPQGGAVEIGAARRSDALHLWVANDAPLADGLVKEGIGLTQTRERLRELYGDRAAVEIEQIGERFSITLTMPWRPLRSMDRSA
jgi:two-component system, LytTR family, sensor kinase